MIAIVATDAVRYMSKLVTTEIIEDPPMLAGVLPMIVRQIVDREPTLTSPTTHWFTVDVSAVIDYDEAQAMIRTALEADRRARIFGFFAERTQGQGYLVHLIGGPQDGDSIVISKAVLDSGVLHVPWRPEAPTARMTEADLLALLEGPTVEVEYRRSGDPSRWAYHSQR